MRTLFAVLLLVAAGCLTVKETRRVIRYANEDKLVSGHMERRQGAKTNAEAYVDEVVSAKLARHWIHIPEGGLIGFLLLLLRKIRKNRQIDEHITKRLNGNGAHGSQEANQGH